MTVLNYEDIGSSAKYYAKYNHLTKSISNLTDAMITLISFHVCVGMVAVYVGCSSTFGTVLLYELVAAMVTILAILIVVDRLKSKKSKFFANSVNTYAAERAKEIIEYNIDKEARLGNYEGDMAVYFIDENNNSTMLTFILEDTNSDAIDLNKQTIDCKKLLLK